MEAGPEVELRQVLLGPPQHDKRLDRALSDSVPEFSRSYLQQLVEAGAVALNGVVATKSAQRVKAGDRIALELRPTPQSQAFRSEALPLQIVYEDDHLLVLDKPAGLVVHPAPGNWSGTLLNGLLAHDARAAGLPRAGIVHRLDKDTSGLMVVARTRSVMDALVRMIGLREVSRQYLAIAHGVWSSTGMRRIDRPVGRDPRNRLRMAVVDLECQAGKSACTDVELLAQADKGCLLRCTLHTGRTHQIRVHLSSVGHPLVADALYGGMPEAGLGRQALHAFRLAFHHPVTETPMVFHSVLPEDMAQALMQWGLRYNPPH